MTRSQSAPFDLQRFVDAQARVYDDVLQELRQGQKRSHWMWFIFPQIAGLGSSAMAQAYALSSVDEAKAYSRHGLLGPRLVECTRLVNAQEGSSAHAIFGSPDDLKFHSCMTLFAETADDPTIFREALHIFHAGQPDEGTLGLLHPKRWGSSQACHENLP